MSQFLKNSVFNIANNIVNQKYITKTRSFSFVTKNYLDYFFDCQNYFEDFEKSDEFIFYNITND